MIGLGFWDQNNKIPISVNGLVLYLTAGKSNSYSGTGTNWNDLSPNNNDGTINGATFSTTNGGQFSFDATNDYVTVANNSTLNPTSQITLSAWVSNNTQANFRGLIMKSSDFNWTDGYGLYQNNGFFTFFINSYNGSQVITVFLDTFSISNIVGVYDGTNLKLYKDGSLIGTGSSYSTAISNSSGILDIGRGSGNIAYWGGIISEVAIYNRGITATEVLNNFNKTKQRFGL